LSILDLFYNTLVGSVGGEEGLPSFAEFWRFAEFPPSFFFWPGYTISPEFGSDPMFGAGRQAGDFFGLFSQICPI
jgi:hypothetical protein